MASPSLSRFPRPNVAVDLALFTVVPTSPEGEEDKLCVVVQRTADSDPALPGRFIRSRRTVEETIEDVVRLKLGLSPSRVRPSLLDVFSDPDRDPRGWTMSLAFSLALPYRQVHDVSGELAPLSRDGQLARGERLAYDHDHILRRALERLRERYESAPDPDGLLEPPFTLSELRRLHELVLGEPLRRDTFNRRMADSLTRATDPSGAPLLRSEYVGRPAQMFTFDSGDPPEPAVPYPLPRTTDSSPYRSPSKRPRS